MTLLNSDSWVIPVSFNRIGTEIKNTSVDITPVRFDYTGNLQEYIVPARVKKLVVDCVGAKGKEGYTSGGKGGLVKCVLNVTLGQKLFIWVGKTPDNARIAEYNASDIRISSADITSEEGLNNRLIVAAGGASSGIAYGGPASGGGNGGGLTGEASAAINNSYSAAGGTQTAGGNGAGNADNVTPSYGDNGNFGLGGNGHNFDDLAGGGAGGAGWYGGGGGSTRMQNLRYVSASGGGGGSSYTHPDLCSEVIHTQGYNDGNGYVIITAVA